VLELKGKVVVPDSYVAAKPTPQNDAIEDALRGLGYSTQEVARPSVVRRSPTTKAPRYARRCSC